MIQNTILRICFAFAFMVTLSVGAYSQTGVRLDEDGKMDIPSDFVSLGGIVIVENINGFKVAEVDTGAEGGFEDALRGLESGVYILVDPLGRVRDQEFYKY